MSDTLVVLLVLGLQVHGGQNILIWDARGASLWCCRLQMTGTTLQISVSHLRSTRPAGLHSEKVEITGAVTEL